MTDTTQQEREAQYRKRPIVVDAVQFTRRFAWPDWFHDAVTDKRITTHGTGKYADPGTPCFCEVHTLEGDMRANENDWIIRGVKGELYPCKPDIFAATYEPALATPQGAEPVAMVDIVPPATARDRWMYEQGRLAERDPRTAGTRAQLVEELCTLIKAADDAAADNDYMLDSDDCICVLRGTWKGPLANDCPPHPPEPKLSELQAELMRCWFVLKDAGLHPGRTDDRLSDVIRRILARQEGSAT